MFGTTSVFVAATGKKAWAHTELKETRKLFSLERLVAGNDQKKKKKKARYVRSSSTIFNFENFIASKETVMYTM